MSAFSGPEISTDGLVFAYDMGNTQKSFKGAPTTNLIDVAENLLSSNWTKEGGFGTVTANYGVAPDNTQTSTRLQYSSGYFYRSSSTTPTITALTPGTTVTFSCWVKGIPQSGRGIGLWSYAVGGIVTTSTQEINPYTWTRVSLTYTIAAGSTTFAIMLAGAPINIFQGDIEVWRPQLEVGSFATPFVNGTRSNTQAIIDQTGLNTVTANSLTYAADGTFSFDGSYGYLQSTSNCNITGSVTLSAWIKPSRSGQTGPHSTVICTDVGYPYGVKLMNYKNNERCVLWLGFGGSTNYEATLSLDINDNTIKMFTGSWDMSTGVVKIYLNGVLQTTINTGYTTPVVLNDGKITIGTDYNNIGSGTLNKYLGSVYNASVYNRALSAAEVRDNFNALRGRFGI